MRILALMIVVFPLLAQAESCGLFQVQDYGDVVAYTLIDFSSQSPQTLNYRVMNSNSPVVNQMVSGLCYCVDGPTAQDPVYGGDLLYQRIEINAILRGPSSGCVPNGI